MKDTLPMKRPAFQLYPAQWLGDVELQACSPAARGLWINACCVMHNCTPYGHLTVNNVAMTDAEAAAATQFKLADYKRCMAELLSKGVAKENGAGIIYSRRMVKDENVRNVRAQFGVLALNNPNVPRPRKNEPGPLPAKVSIKDTLSHSEGILQGRVHGPTPDIAFDSNSKAVSASSIGNGPPIAWFTTQAGIVAKAKSIGLAIGNGESIEQLRDRVRAELKRLQT